MYGCGSGKTALTDCVRMGAQVRQLTLLTVYGCDFLLSSYQTNIPISDGYAIMNHCHEDAPMQKWILSGERLQNLRNRSTVLDISFYNRNRGARVAAWKYHGGMNQHWFRDDPYV